MGWGSRFLWIIALLLTLHTRAQEGKSSVKGLVTDQLSGKIIEAATIHLMEGSDSSTVLYSATDKKGKFYLEGLLHGNYLLAASAVGFKTFNQSISLNKDQKLELRTILLVPDSGSMQEVVVSGKQNLLNNSIDRKVYNISQDLMAQSGTASEVLKNIPSVEVDIDGNVSLRGTGDVMILINGRPSPLMGRSKAEVLQQFPANTIERIEVITNPSAKFRPDGSSGIINIVLKKNIKSGWNGNAVINAGNHDRYNGNINLNYKPGKLNVFTNAGFRKDIRTRYNTTDRAYIDSMGFTSSYDKDESYSQGTSEALILALGLNYNLNGRNSFELSGNAYLRDLLRQDRIQNLFYDKHAIQTSRYDRLRYDPEEEIENDLTASWQHKFKKEDQELSVELTVSAARDREDSRFTEIYLSPVARSSFDNIQVKESDKQQQAAINYTHPLNDDAQLEAGYSINLTQLDLDFNREYYDTLVNRFIKDATVSNRFQYRETIQAIYVTYQKQWEKFGFNIGARAEPVSFRGKLVNRNELISNNYFKFFPTIHLSYKFSKNELQVNYSKRLNRPDGDELNPFVQFNDPRNISAGNPKLLPEIIHSVELGYKWDHKNFSFIPSLYYRYKMNGFTSVTFPIDDSTLLTTINNLSNDQSAGLELIFSFKSIKSFTANLNSNIFYNQIDAGSLGTGNKRAIFSMSANLNSSYAFTPITLLQLSCNFRSARLNAQGKTYGNFVFNAGFRQDIFKKKASLTLALSDLFKTLKQRGELNSTFFNQTSLGRRDAPVIYLGLSYRFGKLIRKKEEEKLLFDNNLQ